MTIEIKFRKWFDKDGPHDFEAGCETSTRVSRPSIGAALDALFECQRGHLYRDSFIQDVFYFLKSAGLIAPAPGAYGRMWAATTNQGHQIHTYADLKQWADLLEAEWNRWDAETWLELETHQ